VQNTLLSIISLLFVSLSSYSQENCNTQIEYLEVSSEILETSRQLKLQKPRNYDPESKKIYPLIFVFDADYLFEPVAGITDYLSYWDEIPEAFVVGVNQSGTRLDDGRYDQEDFLPTESAARFFDFIQVEVLPYLKKNYNIGDFAVAVGHDYMANFINLFLFTDRSDFQGLINLSPDIPDGLMPYIEAKLQNTKEKLWYNITTGTNDLEFIQTKSKALYEMLSGVENENVSVSFKSFENTNHYTLVSYAMPNSLLSMFEPFTPINDLELEEKVLTADNPVDYLEQKYELINDLYNLDQKVRISDMMIVFNVVKKEEKWEYCERLAKIARKDYPASLLYNYFIGKYYQGIGEPKKAYKAYKEGYVYNEAGGITKAMLIDEAKILQDAFGY